MDPIAIHLKEDAGISRKGEPVQIGIPVPRSAVPDDQTPLYLVQQSSGEAVPFQHDITSRWPDGSARWLLVRFLAHIGAGKSDHFVLQTTPPRRNAQEPAARIGPSPPGQLTVSTGLVEFRFTAGSVSWQSLPVDTEKRAASAQPIQYSLTCQDNNNSACTLDMEQDWSVQENGQVCTTLEARGLWKTSQDGTLANLQCRLALFAGSPYARLDVCLHNPERAVHPGGLWDLGDTGSVRFRYLGLETSLPGAQRVWLKPEPTAGTSESTSSSSLRLHQESSGGDAWNSPNHVDASGQVSPQFRGYQLSGAASGPVQGLRAQPVAGIEGTHSRVQASPEKFWQNFPSSLESELEGGVGRIHCGLFPLDTTSPHELQGGERKTQTLWLDFSGAPGALDWVSAPLRPTLPSLAYQQAMALPWFQADGGDGALESLIQAGLDSSDNFFAKREIIDEYGWRHFGDIFADHETLYQAEGEAPLISHYNNQYDALYGFARQFARSGDTRWFELMDDLARHVADIDIYHTEQDRAEYNNGLFWHTDHYLPAHTATHRTFSRHNTTSSTPGQTGGGPAAEHCYTTGLLYHYYFTGCEASRQAVLDLAGWMRAIHEGQGGLLEQLLALKKHDVPKVKALLRGEKPMPYTYPFTRGTGNYINTLLDAWQLEPDGDWCSLAERVIRHTIHPDDDIDRRQLLDVETGWSYLVLLASLARYLWLKEQADQTDDNYRYTRQAFLSYTRWMLRNERPFLEDTGQLEFPNDTWTAQDIRKSMLLYQASLLVENDEAAEFRRQADQWLEQVCTRLSVSGEKHFSRILIILMQNHGPHQATEQSGFETAAAPTSSEPPTLTWFALSTRIIARLARGLAGFRPSRERAWLNARLNRS